MVRSTSNAPTSANVTRAVSRTIRVHPLPSHQSRWSRSAGAVVRSSSPATATSAVRVPVSRSLLHTSGNAGRQRRRQRHRGAGIGEDASRSESTMPRDRTSMSRRYALGSDPARGHPLSPALTRGIRRRVQPGSTSRGIGYRSAMTDPTPPPIVPDPDVPDARRARPRPADADRARSGPPGPGTARAGRSAGARPPRASRPAARGPARPAGPGLTARGRPTTATRT